MAHLAPSVDRNRYICLIK